MVGTVTSRRKSRTDLMMLADLVRGFASVFRKNLSSLEVLFGVPWAPGSRAPGADFVTDVPYMRWDHDVYYDEDPNCWMQARKLWGSGFRVYGEFLQQWIVLGSL